MKEHKRIFAILLSMALVFTYMPVMAFADTGTSNGGAALPFDGGSDTPVTFYNDDGALQTAYRTSNGLAYTLVNSDGLDSVRIIGYNGGGDTINVPAKINGHVVSGFSIDPEKPLDKESYDGIKKINFPDSMIYIRTANLEGFKALESLSGLGGNELDNARYKTAAGVLYKKWQGGGMRVACYPPEKKDKTWTTDPGLTSYVDFPYNPYLEEINVTANAGVDATGNLPNLKAINVSEDVEDYASVDGVLYNKDMTSLYAYPAAKTDKELRLPDTVDYISEDAFWIINKGNTGIETIYLPKNINIYNFSWWPLCESDGLGNLKKIVFTGKTAPEYDKNNNPWVGDYIRRIKANGIELAGPSDGIGYDEFFDAVMSLGMAPVPESPAKLTLDTAKDVEIDPGEVVTFEFTAPKAYVYNISLRSEGPFSYDWCVVEENQNYNSNVQTGLQMWEQGEYIGDEYRTFYGNNHSLNMTEGKKDYLQIRSAETNSKTTLSVTMSEMCPIGLAEIPDNCEEIQQGVTKTAVIPEDDINKVLTYSFALPEKDPKYESENYHYSFTFTRNSEHAENLYFNHSIIDIANGYNFSLTPEDYNYEGFGYSDTLSGNITFYDEYNKTLYVQFMPGVAGECSVTMEMTREGWERDEDEDEDDTTGARFHFSDVPTPDSVESIAVDAEKEVTAESDDETFTYAFVPTVSGNYTFESEGTADTAGRVLDGDKVIGVDAFTRNSTGSDNFIVSFYGEAGKTYYLQAKLIYTDETASFKVVLHDYIAEHQHSEKTMTYHAAVEGTSEDNPGTKAYYECPVCGHIYLDANGNNETTIEKLSVPYGDLVTKFEFTSKRPLQGEVGKDTVDGNYFYEAGNKFVVTFDNGDKREYICAERTGEDYVGYFLDGNTEEVDFCEYLNIAIKSDDGLIHAGKNTVEFSYKVNGQRVKATAEVTGIGDEPQPHTHVAAAPVRENEVAATCTAEGSYDEVVYCKDCGEEMSRTSKTIAKLDHQWDNGTVTTEPTCEAEGVKTFNCENCDATKTEAIPAAGHKWGKATYDWNADFTEVTASHTCGNSCHTGDNPVTETVGASGEVTKAATLDEEGVMTYTSEAFSKEGFEVQTKTQPIPRLTLDEALNEATDKTEAAQSDASAADAVSASSTDEADVADAEAAAQDAANKAAVVEAAAQNLLDSANEAFAALPDNASAEDVAAAQDVVNKATETLAAAKKVKAAANSALATAKKAAAKVASNKAAAASAAASSAANSAQAEAYRKQAEEAAAAAAAKAQAADQASADATQAAQDLTALAENADASIQAAIADAATAAAASANDASNAAESADKSSSDANTSESNAKKAVDDKAAAEKKAAADAAAKAAAAQKAAAEQALIAANNGIIDPTLPKVKIKGPKKAKKSFTAQWKKLNKKQQKKVKGIEIEYSLTKDFQNPVFKATSKKKANIKVKKLKSKKTYYVRAHTYVIRNGQRYVSNWSATKKVKVK